MRQFSTPSHVHICGVRLKRFHQLEREYRVLLKQIAQTMSARDLAQLKKHRNEIVVEARQIARSLNAPRPQWCGSE